MTVIRKLNSGWTPEKTPEFNLVGFPIILEVLNMKNWSGKYKLIYRKIPIINPRGLFFGPKGLFAKFFLGRALYSGGGLYMDEYLRFEKRYFFVQAVVNFF